MYTITLNYRNGMRATGTFNRLPRWSYLDEQSRPPEGFAVWVWPRPGVDIIVEKN